MYLYWLYLFSNLLVMLDKFFKFFFILIFLEFICWVIVCRDDVMLFCLSEIFCMLCCNVEYVFWLFMVLLISIVICFFSVVILFFSVCFCRIFLVSMLFKMVVLLEDEDDVFFELFFEFEYVVWKNFKIFIRVMKYLWCIMIVWFNE